MTDGWKVHLNGVQEIVESRVRHPHLNIAQHDEMVIGGNNIWLTEIRYGRWEMEWEQEMAVGRSRDKAWWEYDIVSGNRGEMMCGGNTLQIGQLVKPKLILGPLHRVVNTFLF